MNQFAKQLFLKANVIVSMFAEYDSSDVPLLFYIAQTHNTKMISLFLDCLFRMGKTIDKRTTITTTTTNSNDKTEENDTAGSGAPRAAANKFLNKYFNFAQCNEPMISFSIFWGFNCGAQHINDNLLKIVELIMRLSYFKGMNEKRDDIDFGVQGFVSQCIDNNAFGYLSLVSKYIDKNDRIVGISLNSTQGFGEKIHPLVRLLESEHVNEEWVKLYFDLCKKCKVCFDQTVLNQAIQVCNGDEKLTKYTSMVQDNFDKLKIFLK